MLKGTLRNKTSGDTITVENVSNRGTQVWATVVGEQYGTRSFNKVDWHFIETTPTADEFVLSLPVGTVFSSSSRRYVKVSDTRIYNTINNEFVDLAKWPSGWFSRDERITIKQD